MTAILAYHLQVPVAYHLRGTFYISRGKRGLRPPRRQAARRRTALQQNYFKLVRPAVLSRSALVNSSICGR